MKSSISAAARRPHWRSSRSLQALALPMLGLLAATPALAQSYRYAGQFGTTGAGALNFPNDVQIDHTSHNIVVSDASNNRVVVFNSAGSYLNQFGSAGTGDAQFDYPAGIGIDPVTHDIFVADYYNDRVQVFSSSGTYQSQFGAGSLPTPCGIAIFPATRNIAVSDGYGASVQIYGPSETFSSQFGSATNFGYACSLAIDANNNILVADQTNNNVQKFSAAGAYLGQFGSFGSGDGQFATPSPGGIAIDPPTGNIIVSDYGNDRVEIFDSNGVYLSQFGGFGTGNSQFNGPTGVAIDPTSYNLLVADRSNNRIQVFSPCGPTQVSLSILPLTASQNQDILFSARVGISQPFGGTVSFLVDGSGTACTAAVGDVDASCTTVLQLGTHTVTAQYSGNGFNPAGCSAAGSVTVIQNTMQAPTNVVLVGPPNGLDEDQDMSLTATVAPGPASPAAAQHVAGSTSGSSMPGFVTFYDGATVLGYATLVNNQATYSNKLAAGTYNFSAKYSGDSVNAASTGAVSVSTVKPGDDIFYNSLEVPPGG
jgi:DNA-binding beta-propeller fold protein YncE